MLGRCNPESANGLDKTVYHLSSKQAAAGHDVRVLSLTEKEALPIPGVDVRVYAPLFTAPRFVPGALGDMLIDRSPLNLPPRLIRELLDDPPDVVHFHYIQVPQAARLSRTLRTRGIPYCVTLNGALVGEAATRRKWIKKLYRLLAERRYLDGAAFLHAISPVDAEGARDANLTAPIDIIPNGIDAELAGPVPPEDLAVRYPELRDRRILLFLGRLDPEQKGLDVLLEALALSDTDIGLVLVGPPFRANQEALEAEVRPLGLEDRVVFAGPLFGTEKLGAVCGANGFVHPSRWEAGVPFSVMEAAACAVPCIVSRAADPDGYLVDGGGALAAEPEPEALAAAIRSFAAMSEVELQEMGERARGVVLERFDWKRIAERVVESYEAHCRR
ncbi:MAG: glycosyltransferase [Gemmatimonadota bacterium]